MSAGLATRLRPITEEFPKCLLSVNGNQMLDLWLTSCLRAECFDTINVNVHHCPNIVTGWLKTWKEKAIKIFGKKASDSVIVIDETTKLLGTAGTLFWHGDTSKSIFMAYTDTYSKEMFLGIGKMAKRWKDNPDNAIAGLITFNVPPDRSAGSMEVDKLRMIQSFKEKDGTGIVGWAGMMFARKEFYNELTRHDFDLARDVFPRLNGRMLAFEHVSAYDIGRGIEEYEHLNASV